MVDVALDRELEQAQAALLARFAPETRVRRVRWSQGETQLFELGSGRTAAVRPRRAGRGITRSCRSSRRSQRTTAFSQSIDQAMASPIRSTTAASTFSATLGRSCATSWMRSSSRLSTSSPTRWARSGLSPSRSRIPAGSRASHSSAHLPGSGDVCHSSSFLLGLPLIGPAAWPALLLERDTGREPEVLRSGSRRASGTSRRPVPRCRRRERSDETSRACSA